MMNSAVDDAFRRVLTLTSLNRAASNVIGWVATLHSQGIDLTGNAHLKVLKEAKEYAADQSLEEAADVFISLIASLADKGHGTAALAKAVEDKMIINRQRQWEQQGDGTYQHVK